MWLLLKNLLRSSFKKSCNFIEKLNVRMNKLQVIFLVMLFSLSCTAIGQNKLSVSNMSARYIDIPPVHNAGMEGRVITDDSQWLNYTILIHPSEPTCSITVEIASGMVPDGMQVYVEADPYYGMTKGKPGVCTGKILVSNMPRVLIDNIGTFYTGSGRNEGHKLTFSFVVTDYAKLKSGTNSLYILYTITQ